VTERPDIAPAESLLDEIPGYREVIEQEATAREAAFLDLPVQVAGVECVQLTPRRFVHLAIARSPFAKGGPVSAGDLALALWVISTAYVPGDIQKRDQFIESIADRNAVSALAELKVYFEDAFADAPGTSAEGASDIAPTSWVADLVDMMALEYGWAENAVLDCPFVRLWQYFRRMALRADPKRIMFSRAHKVRAKWLEERNARRADG
jgi:hypothetical protein